MTPKVRNCFEAAVGLGPEDTARFVTQFEQYKAAGASPEDSARSAAADLLADIAAEAKEIGELIGGMVEDGAKAGTLTEAQARQRFNWQDMGTKDGTKTHALFFSDPADDRPMRYGEVSLFSRSTRFQVDGGESAATLKLAKTEAERVAIARLERDGYVGKTPQATAETVPAEPVSQDESEGPTPNDTEPAPTSQAAPEDLTQDAPKEPEAQETAGPASPITDVGEKIGGARKDTAISGGTRSKRASEDDQLKGQAPLLSQIRFKPRAPDYDQTKTAEFKRWSNDAPLITSADAATHQFKTGKKVVVEAFHGTKRPDRIGSKFLRKRATSGPMAYHTSDPALASNYASGKQDTSLYNEDQNYESWFKYKPQGQRTPSDIVRAWHSLTPAQKDTVAALAPRVMFSEEQEENGGNKIVLGPEDHDSGTGSYDYNLAQTRTSWDRRGNPMKALVEDWLNSGNLFDDEQRFMQVLKLAGFPIRDVTFDSPNAEYPFVFKNYIAMQKPLVTSDIPQAVTDALNAASKRDRSKAQAAGSDMWDKNTRTLRDWVENFNDPVNDQRSYVWTSIPDKVTEVFKALGYDGIIDWSGKGGGNIVAPVYVPFEETQVKSALGNKGTFSADKNDILLKQSEPFYSALSRAIESVAMKQGTAGAWTQALKGMLASGKVKADEIEWTGLKDWLDLIAHVAGKDIGKHAFAPGEFEILERHPGGKITKKQIAEYLAANGVQVTETVLGAQSNAEADKAMEKWGIVVSRNPEDENQVAFLDRDNPDDLMTADELESAGYPIAAVRAAMEIESGGVAVGATGFPKYSQYTLPGGTNYREVLLTLPAAETPEQTRVRLKKKYPEWKEGVRYDTFMSEADQRDLERSLEGSKANYKSAHWDQPNVLAHIRLNDRTDAEGKRVLFVEEIQSDWGQAGKKQGFDDAAKLKQRKVLEDEADVLREEGNEIHRGKSWAQISAADSKRLNEIDRRLEAIQREIPLLTKIPSAPFVTHTDKWLALALKRVIKIAVDEGYDRVAFVNGEQSAERYDLSKQVSAIDYWKNDDGTFRVRVRDMKDDTAWKSDRATGPELADTVGKEIADKIVNGEGKQGVNGGSNRIEGLDLKVGGEGMKAFYDKIVPAALKDVLKKVGGEGQTSVSVQGESKYEKQFKSKAEAEAWAEANLGDHAYRVYGASSASKTFAIYDEFTNRPVPDVAQLTQPGFDITPAMRSKAADGLPLFKSTASTTGTDPGKLTDMVANIRAGWADAPPVTVVGTVLDLPIKLLTELRRANAMNTARALIIPNTGQVYLIADRLGSLADAQFVLFHEVLGHYGLRKFLGADYEKTMRQMRAMNADLADESRSWMAEYGPGQIEARVKRGMSYAEATVEVDLLSVEEALADRAGKPEQISGFKRLVAKLQAWLRDHGLMGAAQWLEGKTQAQVLSLLQSARDAVEKAEGVHAYTEPAAALLSQADQTETPAFRKWFGDSKVVDAGRGKNKAVNAFNNASGDYNPDLDPYWLKKGAQEINGDGMPDDEYHQAVAEYANSWRLDKLLEEQGWTRRGSSNVSSSTYFVKYIEDPTTGDEKKYEIRVSDHDDRHPADFDIEQRFQVNFRGGVEQWSDADLGPELSSTEITDRLKDILPNESTAPDSGGAGRVAQTETPAFKRWFGDSKVVDADGKPLVVYHGGQKLTAWNKKGDNSQIYGGHAEAVKREYGSMLSKAERQALDQPVHFFTDDESVAAGYGDQGSHYEVRSEFLKMERPLDLRVDVAGESAVEAAMKRILGADYEMPARGYSQQREISQALRWNWSEVRGVVEGMGHDGIILYDTDVRDRGSHTSYAVFRPEQIKSATGNSGAFDPGNPSILLSQIQQGNIPGTTDTEQEAIARGYKARVKRALKRADGVINGLGELPDTEQYLGQRYLALGKIAAVDKIAGDIRAAFRKASQADKKEIYAYLTTAGANTDAIADPETKTMAAKVKRYIGTVGDQLVARGLISEESREAYRDAYLPRLYLAHLLSDGDWRAIGAGKKVSDMGYLKARKDIPQEIRDVILGEVKDPAFLAATAIAKPMRDMALLDWLAQISENQQWVLANSMTEWNGKRVSVFWLKAEADALRTRARHYPEAANRTAANAVAERMDAAAIEAMDGADVNHKDYKQIPNQPKYGRLRGIYVRSEIYNDLMGAQEFLPSDPGWAMHLLGYGGLGTKATQLWKMSKVALNIPGQVRNAISNGVMLQLSGVPFHKLPILMGRAISQIRHGGRHWLVAKKYGVTESTFQAQEMFRARRDLLDLERDLKGLTPLVALKTVGAVIADAAGDAYQFTEALFKTVKIMDAMEREGMDEEAAAIEAQKWLFDYSLVDKNVRYLRNAPVGMPFLTYTTKVLPRLAEVALLHPQRFLPWVALMYGMQAWAQAMFGGDDDEWDELKKALPKWMQEKGHVAFLPWRDDAGRLQAVDMSYFFPWSQWAEFGSSLTEGDLKGAGKAMGLFGGPVTSVITAWATGEDSFTGRQIINEGDPTSYQAASLLAYTWDLMMPPMMGSSGVVSPMWLLDPQYGGKLAQASTGATNRMGDQKATYGQAASRIVGFNAYGIDPEVTRTSNLIGMKADIAKTKAAVQSKLSNQGLTPSQRKKLLEDYGAELKKRAKEMKKYAEESTVPEFAKAIKE